MDLGGVQILYIYVCVCVPRELGMLTEPGLTDLLIAEKRRVFSHNNSLEGLWRRQGGGKGIHKEVAVLVFQKRKQPSSVPTYGRIDKEKEEDL